MRVLEAEGILLKQPSCMAELYTISQVLVGQEWTGTDHAVVVCTGTYLW